MVNVWIRWADGRAGEGKVEDIAEAVRGEGAVVWVDMEAPTEEEYRVLSDVFRFHPLAIEDAIKFAQRPKIEGYTGEGDCAGKPYYYMVIHGPDLDAEGDEIRTKELDLFFSERYLVTIHEEAFRAVNEVKARVSADPGRRLGEGVDALLYGVLDRLIDYYQPILDRLGEALDELEEEALADPRPEVLAKVSVRKRELLNLRRLAGPQREVVGLLARGDVPVVRDAMRPYFRDVQDHVTRHVEMIEVYRDLVMGARDLYLSSISNRLNQVMKTLTLITVIALPMTVVTSFFGMNFDKLPGLHSWGGFIACVAAIAVLEVVLIWMFKRKGWV